jgi:hypothetical protein
LAVFISSISDPAVSHIPPPVPSTFPRLFWGDDVSTHTFTERFYGFTENAREVEMDTREMVDKVKKGEPLYGKSQMSSYLQGMAARNSRYSELFIHVVPWFNFVNHDQVSPSFMSI